MTWPDHEATRRLTIAGSLLLLAGVVMRLLEWTFANRPIVAVAISAFLLDIWWRRLGGRWSPSVSRAGSFKTAIAGFAVGLAIGFFSVVGAAASGRASVVFGHFSLAGVAVGSVRAGVYALRDELLFRGTPLALAGEAPRPWPLLFSALLGVAPLVLVPGVRIEAILLGLIAGLFFALQWKEGAGGLSAWASHTGWLLATQVVTRGTVVDVGLPAYLAVLAFAASGWLLCGRKRWWRN
jgi:hypothetical protein